MSTSHVYVTGYDSGKCFLSEILSEEEKKAPLLFSWRVDPPVELLAGELTGDQVIAWCSDLMMAGHTFKGVSQSTSVAA